MARAKTTYEWRLNYRDDCGGIEDIDFFDTYKEALDRWSKDEGASDIELTKVVGDEDDGIHYMEYATVMDGELPQRFDEGSKVNKCHHDEVAKAHKA